MIAKHKLWRRGERERVMVFEMWVWRRREKRKSVNTVNNKEVLNRTKENRILLDIIPEKEEKLDRTRYRGKRNIRFFMVQ